MRNRNGVALDGGGDLGGVDEGETIIKTYCARKKNRFSMKGELQKQRRYRGELRRGRVWFLLPGLCLGAQLV